MTNARLVNRMVTNMLVNYYQELSLLCEMRQCYKMNL